MFPADKYPTYVETLAVSTVTVLLGLLALVLPLFFLAILLLPLPMVYLIVKRDLNQGLLALVLAAVFIFLAVGNVPLVLLLLLHIGPPAVVIGLLIKNRVSVEQSIYVLFFWALVVAGINLSYLSASGVSGFDNATGEINSVVEQMSERYLDGGIIDDSERRQLTHLTEQMARLVWLFLPGSVIVWTYTATLCTFFIARRLLGGLGYTVPGGISFSRWRLPWYSIWLVITGLALTLAGEEFSIAWAGVLGKNILFVSAFIFFVLGISVMVYLFQVWKMARIVKIIIAVIIVMYLPFVILALGMVDPVANLRRLSGDGSEGK